MGEAINSNTTQPPFCAYFEKTRQTLAPTPGTRALRHPTATRSYRDTNNVRGVMLKRSTELLVGTQSLPIDRQRSRLPTQNPVSKYVYTLPWNRQRTGSEYKCYLQRANSPRVQTLTFDLWYCITLAVLASCAFNLAQLCGYPGYRKCLSQFLRLFQLRSYFLAEEMTQTCVTVGNERLCKQLGDVPAFTDMKPNDFMVSNRSLYQQAAVKYFVLRTA